jgi:glucosyl-3-phosphoglycerate synthase
VDIARTFGADVYDADAILTELPAYRGKGENLWKALYITGGDIIVYIDADIKNIHHRFAYGLIGPLLLDRGIMYSKAFYDRPIATGKYKIRPTGGGRVTELVIRPLFSLFFPELTQIMQPLSGEYAGYRELLEKIPFPIGYGIETSMIIDIYKNWGLDVIAQVDMDRRIHRNQDTKALGRMAFVILKTYINRKIDLGMIALNETMYDEMIQYNLIEDRYRPDILKIEGHERPPMIEIPAYRVKFRMDPDDSTGES